MKGNLTNTLNGLAFIIGVVLMIFKVGGIESISWWLISALIFGPWVLVFLSIVFLTGAAAVGSVVDANPESHLDRGEIKITVGGKDVSLEELLEMLNNK